MSAPTTSDLVSSETSCHDAVLVRAISRLLSPLARLCLANGVAFASVEELLKHAFVREALALQPGEIRHGAVSRISTATGLSRREVTNLIKSDAPARSTKPPVCTELFARWTSDHNYRDSDGFPLVLKRQGPEPSFEALAQSVTRDVHPRSLLDELSRLELVRHDSKSDRVSLTRSAFVPRGDSRQMLDFLGENVGDHFDAAVANVMHDGSRHLEQAVFADELSSDSLPVVRRMVAEQWRSLRDAMVPALTELIESDRQAGRTGDQRLRIGLYTFDERVPNDEAPAHLPAAPGSADQPAARTPKTQATRESSKESKK